MRKALPGPLRKHQGSREGRGSHFSVTQGYPHGSSSALSPAAGGVYFGFFAAGVNPAV